MTAGSPDGIGWRLTLEPCADMVAWSLLKSYGPHTPVETWSGLIRDATHARDWTSRLVDDARPGLFDSEIEAIAVRELGAALLPRVLRAELSASTGTVWLTLCTRGWLSRVPWDALALNQDGLRVVERCVLLGGLPPGLLEEEGPPPPARTQRRHPPESLWVVDPGPPEGGPKPLYPAGYPDEIARMPGPGDRLVPDGMRFTSTHLSQELRSRPWSDLIYLGHVGAISESPAGACLVLADESEEPFTAHAWLHDPQRWPAPPRVALLGCGSDDTAAPEHSGLITAALHAGADLVTGTRWSLPNSGGVVRLLAGVSAAFATAAVPEAIRRWQLGELAEWRRASTQTSSPAYWATLVTYDRARLIGATR